MRKVRILWRLAVVILAVIAPGQGTRSAAAEGAPQPQPAQPLPVARVVDLKGPDGTLLKASYFAAAKPGPGVLLLHQSNRTRKFWDDLAGQLAAAGINTLTLDMRGFGESGGTPRRYDRSTAASDTDTALQYLVSQPGVKRDVIGVGGAGWLGVLGSVDVARQHTAEVKSLVLLSGETLQDGLQFLRQASQLPGLFVVADEANTPPRTSSLSAALDALLADLRLEPAPARTASPSTGRPENGFCHGLLVSPARG